MIKKTFRIIGSVFAVMLFLFGMLIFSYPFINRYVVSKHNEEKLENFHRLQSIVSSSLSDDSQSQPSVSDEKATEINTDINIDTYDDTDTAYDFTGLYEDMQQYNLNIYDNGQQDLKDAWSYEQSAFDLSSYGIYDGITAELRIPKMNVDLPIYLGATLGNMGAGAAQLGQTSMPIGGNNTNCVIAGHRGCSAGRFFLDIELLSIGDKIYIDNLWETLTYRVDEIEVIDPSDIDKIYIQDNKDMVTLITCHPYPYNSERYVVYCVRCPNDEPEENSSDESVSDSQNSLQSQTQPQTQSQKPSQSQNQSQTEVQTSSQISENDSSQLFIKFENSLYILVPLALLLLAFYLFKMKKR